MFYLDRLRSALVKPFASLFSRKPTTLQQLPETPQPPSRIIQLEPGTLLKAYRQEYLQALRRSWQAQGIHYIPPIFQPSQPLPQITLPPDMTIPPSRVFRPYRLIKPPSTTIQPVYFDFESEVRQSISADLPLEASNKQKDDPGATQEIGILEKLAYCDCENWQDLKTNYSTEKMAVSKLDDDWIR